MSRPDDLGAMQAGTAMMLVGSSVAASSLVTRYPILGGQAARYGLGAAVLAALARGRLPRPRRSQIPRLLALAATGLAGFNVFLIAALRTADPGSVGVIIGCLPLVMAVLGPARQRRAPKGQVVAAAVIVSAGAAFVQWSGGTLPPASLALALGALACEAAFSLFAVPLLESLGPLGVSAYACAAAAAMLLAGAVAVDGTGAFRLPTASEAEAFAYLGLVVTAVAFILWYSGLRRLGAGRAGLFAGLVPVAALVTSAAAGTTTLSLARLAGAVTVSAGVALGMTSRPAQRGAAATSRVTGASAARRAPHLVTEDRLGAKKPRRAARTRARHRQAARYRGRPATRRPRPG
jgi:drug/metabolite transporter (DMT)-like permease